MVEFRGATAGAPVALPRAQMYPRERHARCLAVARLALARPIPLMSRRPFRAPSTRGRIGLLLSGLQAHAHPVCPAPVLLRRGPTHPHRSGRPIAVQAVLARPVRPAYALLLRVCSSGNRPGQPAIDQPASVVLRSRVPLLHLHSLACVSSVLRRSCKPRCTLALTVPTG